MIYLDINKGSLRKQRISVNGNQTYKFYTTLLQTRRTLYKRRSFTLVKIVRSLLYYPNIYSFLHTHRNRKTSHAENNKLTVPVAAAVATVRARRLFKTILNARERPVAETYSQRRAEKLTYTYTRVRVIQTLTNVRKIVGR